MKGVVVYGTSHGNTKKIAETIVETLRESRIEVDLFHVKDAKKLSAKDFDFLVLGSPTRISPDFVVYTPKATALTTFESIS